MSLAHDRTGRREIGVPTSAGRLGAKKAGGARHDLPISELKLRHLLVLGCGCAASFNVRLIGDVYGAELLLPLLALVWLPGRRDIPILGDRRFVVLVIALFVSLLGYMVSDLLQGTREDQYLRGWGRILVLFADLVCLAWVCGGDRRNLWWFALGMGLGALLTAVAAGHGLATHWKSDYAKAFALIASASGAILGARLLAGLFAAIGATSMFLDFRSFSAVCLAVAAYAGSRVRATTASQSRIWVARAAAVLAFSLALVSALWLSGVTNSDDSLKRRDQSNAGRAAGWSAGLYAIGQSPIIGWGSWTENRELARYRLKEAQKRYRDRNGRSSAGEYFAPHSQIIQSWVEGGILGAAFFLVLLLQLGNALRLTIFSHVYGALTPLIVYLLLLEAWDLFMSPFAAGHRLDIAMAAVASVLAVRLLSEGSKVGLPKSPDDANTLLVRRPVNRQGAVRSRPQTSASPAG